MSRIGDWYKAFNSQDQKLYWNQRLVDRPETRIKFDQRDKR